VPWRPVALVGTTASGKSALAMEVAREFGDLVLLQVDSMCVYRELDIGTAKPTRAERSEVPHRLVDLCDPAEEFSVAEFQLAARAALEEAAASGRQALLVGGTGLYHRSVLDDLELPGRYPEVAAELATRLDREGPGALYAELEGLDPVAAAKMTPTNARRICRALEVCLGSGRPFSSFGAGLETYRSGAMTQVGLLYDKARSDLAIAIRVEAFMAAGFLHEVEQLAVRPRGLSRTARQAVGYRQLLSYLDGDLDLDQTLTDTVVATTQLARRQWAWFRRDPRVKWVDPAAGLDALRSALLDARDEVRD